MNRLLIRTLAIGLATLASFVGVAALVMSLGLPGLLSDWERNNHRLLADFVARQLDTLARDPDTLGLEGEALKARLREVLRDLPVRPEYVVVVDADDKPVFINHLGKDPPGPGTDLVQRLLKTASWQAVNRSGKPWLRHTLAAMPFDMDESNRVLTSTLGLMAVWSLAGAGLVAALTAWLVSRPLSRQAGDLVRSLRQIQAGRRDLELAQGGVAELAEIAAGIRGLQESLGREELLRQQWQSDIAHDLRTPLTVLKGQFEGMLDGVFAPDKDRLARNYQEILRLEHLVLQLSELTRLETPDLRIRLQDLDAGQVLENLASRFADLAAGSGYRLEVRLPASGGVVFKADPVLLERALDNLVGNAIRHGQGDGTIILESGCGLDGQTTFTVENPGLIPQEHLPRLFDRLYRADSSRGSPGTGLGLSIVKAIARAHGGSVRVDCDREAGRTRFALSLPGTER